MLIAFIFIRFNEKPPGSEENYNPRTFILTQYILIFYSISQIFIRVPLHIFL